MNRHRFLPLKDTRPLPGAAGPALSVSGFVMCPAVLQPGLMGQAFLWQQVYQAAFAQARAVHRPSLLERFHAVSRN